MIHLGDITKINGAEVPVVDIICGGSPCQDLSVAGKRAGLSGERSGLFIEQIRIIKEMRAKDVADGRAAHLARPRFAVWENVPGAFSSNGGEPQETTGFLSPGAHPGGCNGQDVYSDMLVTDEPSCIGNGQADQLKMSEKVGALNCI